MRDGGKGLQAAGLSACRSISMVYCRNQQRDLSKTKTVPSELRALPLIRIRRVAPRLLAFSCFGCRHSRSSAHRSRDRVLMCESSVKIRYKLLILLDGSRKSIQASKPIDLFLMANPGRLQRPPQNTEGLIIRLQRYRKRMPVLPACAKENRAGSEKRVGVPWITSATRASD